MVRSVRGGATLYGGQFASRAQTLPPGDSLIAIRILFDGGTSDPPTRKRDSAKGNPAGFDSTDNEHTSALQCVEQRTRLAPPQLQPWHPPCVAF